jgi:peptidoglycan hydrolase CwlO-like protein
MIMKNKVILATLLLIAFLSFVFYHFFKEDNISEIRKPDNQINELKFVIEEKTYD